MSPLKRVASLTLGLMAMALLPIVIFAFTQLRTAVPQDVNLDFSSATSLSFLVAGDQGTGNLRQWQVAAGMEHSAANEPVQAVLLLGDNFYRYGVTSTTDWQWRYKFEHVYSGSLAAVPFFATLGNHDYYGNELAQINYDLKNLGSQRWQMPARDYVQVFGQVEGEAESQDLLRVAFIDTGLWLRSPVDAAQTLERLLASTRPARWTVVVTHTPLISGNKLDVRPETLELWQPVLIDHDVDLVLSGHDHNMQLLERDDWPLQAIAGVGGKSGQALDFDNVQGQLFYSEVLGFCRLDVSAEKMSLQYYDHEGLLLYETVILND